MTPLVRLLVGRYVIISLKGREVTLPCFHRTTDVVPTLTNSLNRQCLWSELRAQEACLLLSGADFLAAAKTQCKVFLTAFHSRVMPGRRVWAPYSSIHIRNMIYAHSVVIYVYVCI